MRNGPGLFAQSVPEFLPPPGLWLSLMMGEPAFPVAQPCLGTVIWLKVSSGFETIFLHTPEPELSSPPD